MGKRPEDYGFTGKQAADARVLWDAGHSAAEIGRRIGKSKSAVVGLAHRSDFPSRPSPIVRGGEKRAPHGSRLRPGASTLPPLASLATDK